MSETFFREAQMLVHLTVCAGRWWYGGVTKNTSLDRQIILYLSVRGHVKNHWEEFGAL